MADTRASTYVEDGTRIWRASSFGYCEEYLVRVATGQTPSAPPANIVAAMEKSSEHEPDILAELGKRGWRLFDHHDLSTKMNHAGVLDPKTGQLECELAVPKGVIRCHPDGIAECFAVKTDVTAYDLEQRVVVEVKALRKGSWANPLEKEGYAWQGSIEAAVTGLPLLFVVAWKDEDGELCYDGEDLDLTISYVEKLPHSKGEIIGRTARLNKKIRDYEDGKGLPGCDFKMWPCGFWQEHDVSEGSIWNKDVAELPADVEPSIRGWAYKWQDAKERADKAGKDKSAASKKLMELLEKAGVEAGDKVAGQGFEYSVVESRSTKYDDAAAKKDGVDLSKYKVSTPYTFVKVVSTDG